MIFRTLDQNGDFMFGHGKRDYLHRDKAISEDIRTALLLFLKDAFWDVDSGIDWWNLLGGKNPTAQNEILLQTRRTILSRYGVVKVNDLSYVMDRTSRGLSIIYNIDTIFTHQYEEIVYANPIGFTDSSGNAFIDSDGYTLND